MLGEFVLADSAVLLPVDVQQAFDDPSWGPRNNPELEANAKLLLQAWRGSGRPVVHAKHNSTEEGSTLWPGAPGNAFKPGFEPLVDEAVVEKTVNAAFIGTTLEADLKKRGITQVVVFGITTDMCVSTTVRVGHNLGFDMVVVSDSCATFDQTSPGGERIPAALLHKVHLTTLNTEFATAVDTAAVAAALWASPPPRLPIATAPPVHMVPGILGQLAALQSCRIVLASKSPRRCEILNDLLKLDCEIRPSTFAEDLPKAEHTAASYVQHTALHKTREVWKELAAEAAAAGGDYLPVDIVIGCDTVVVLGEGETEVIMEKPADAAAATAMLRSLSDNGGCRVCSGVIIIVRLEGAEGGCTEESFVDTTVVEFAPLSDGEIAAYVATNEPFDKAGGFGIQSLGGTFVRGIKGDYYNVVGLPLHRTGAALARVASSYTFR
jgi:MAF protein